jgi:hypothetical protein
MLDVVDIATEVTCKLWKNGACETGCLLNFLCRTTRMLTHLGAPTPSSPCTEPILFTAQHIAMGWLLRGMERLIAAHTQRADPASHLDYTTPHTRISITCDSDHPTFVKKYHVLVELARCEDLGWSGGPFAPYDFRTNADFSIHSALYRRSEMSIASATAWSYMSAALLSCGYPLHIRLPDRNGSTAS